MNRTRTLFAAITAILLASLGVASAFADSHEVDWTATFDAAGWLEYVGPGDAPLPASTAVFEFDGEDVSAVTVIADGQHIEGTLSSLVLCESDDCQNSQSTMPNPTKVLAIQTYEMHVDVSSTSLVPYAVPSFAGGEVVLAEVVSGSMHGDVGGAFVTGEGVGKVAGSLGLAMDGTASFACFSPNPGPLAPCMAGDGVMLPLDLDFLAEGDYAIEVTEHITVDPGSRVFELGDLAVDMSLHVDLDGLASHSESAITSEGTITVTNLTVSFE